MKYLLVLLMITLSVAALATGQTRRGKKRAKRIVKPPVEMADAPTAPPTVEEWRAHNAAKPEPPPPAPAPQANKNVRRSSDVLKLVSIGESGVKSLQIPEDLIAKDAVNVEKSNGKVSWNYAERGWRQAGIEFPYALEADLTVKTYNNDFNEIVPELSPEMATPENLNLIGLLADIKKKNETNSPVKEAKVLEIGGIAGEFFVVEYRGATSRWLTGWSAYRYYQDKPQEISLTVTGSKEELETAKKIVESLALDTTSKN